ncbi:MULTISPECIES: hypothetical protein [Dietzia]|uniref:hypothetical protein n=1 Tax=Dietzia TaxID=37914 RepID=UPI000D095710|nr:MULTISPECIES: hypothetical protein [Dietzia]AVM63624.1 hypothetical protein C3V38_03620 [Dietzia sp. oral taxon 368]MCT2274625.1 hypothetical protein [Dietzia cinnamea]
MFARNRTLAGASAVALAAGATFAGAGIASAQDDEEPTGSLGSSSIDLGEIAGDLETAGEALSGPVTVAPNEEGGPTVTYTNRNDFEQRCVGFTMPYSTVDEEDIDPSAIGGDVIAALPVITAIEAAGDVSILYSNDAGEPSSHDSAPGGGLLDPDARGVIQAVLGLLEPTVEAGVTVQAGEAITWAATGPQTPAAAVTLCVPDADEALLDLNFGIDPQVVADQINGRIPGGSVEPVSAGSISGGSVATGANLLGSLAAASSEDEPADGEEADAGGAAASSGAGEGGSGGDDTGELPPLEPVE